MNEPNDGDKNMKERLLFIGSLVGLLVLTSLGQTQLSPAKAAGSLQTGEAAIAVVKANIAAINEGNFEKAFAFYTEDSIVFNPLGLFVGKAEISKWLTIDINSKVMPVDFKMENTLVVSTGTIALGRLAKMGIGEVKYRAEYLVKGDKILFFAPTVTLTPEQQEKMKVAQAAMPPPPTATVNPVEVAKGYVEAINKGEFEKAIAFFGESSAAFVANSTLLLSNRKQVADWLKEEIKTTRATSTAWEAMGNVVINTGTVTLDQFKRLGIDPVQYRALYVVENGKIRFFRPAVILTPEQQAKMATPAATKAP